MYSVLVSSIGWWAQIPLIGWSRVVGWVIFSKGHHKKWCPLIVHGSHTQTVVTQCNPVTVDCYIPRHEGVSGIQLAQSSVSAQSRLPADRRCKINVISWQLVHWHYKWANFMSCILQKTFWETWIFSIEMYRKNLCICVNHDTMLLSIPTAQTIPFSPFSPLLDSLFPMYFPPLQTWHPVWSTCT